MQKANKILGKIMLSILLVCGLIGKINLSAYASAPSNDAIEIVDGSKLLKEDTSTVILYNPTRGNILNRGEAALSNNGNGKVNVFGAVYGAVYCDKLTLKMTLQRLQNGSWVDVKYYSDTVYNQALLAKSYNTTVSKGYYYRIKAACTATDSGVTESQLPVTDGLWID